MEDVGVRPEAAFKVDREGDKALCKGQREGRGAQFKVRIKDGFSLRGTFIHNEGRKSKNKKEKELRFFHKAFAKRFLSGGIPVKLLLDPDSKGKSKIEFSKDDVGDENSEIRDKIEREEEIEGEIGFFKLHEVQQKTKIFNQRLREEPKNEDLWLEYVDFQDVTLDTHHAQNVVMKRRALAEKKLAILSKAIEVNPMNHALYVKRLDLGKEVFESKTLDSQWKELLTLFPRNVHLWVSYLQFVTSHFTSFSVDKVNRAYRTCLEKLRMERDNCFEKDKMEFQMISILNDYCHFLGRSGFREKSIAVYQAMIELNGFSPDFPGYFSLNDKLSLFKEFWESGSPRFGENGMSGWIMMVKKGLQTENKAEEHDDDDEEEDELIGNTKELVHKNKLWLEIESNRERNHFLPWKNPDEEPTDEDRCVRFNSIYPYLFEFGQSQLYDFIALFLDFLGFEFRQESFFPSPDSARRLKLNRAQNEKVDQGFLQKTSPNLMEDEKYRHLCRNVFFGGIQVLPRPDSTRLTALWINFELEFGNKKMLKENLTKFVEKDQKNFILYAEYAKAVFKMDGFKKAESVLKHIMNSIQHHGIENDLEDVLTSNACIVIAEMHLNGIDPKKVDFLLWILCHFYEPNRNTAFTIRDKMALLNKAQEVKVNINDVFPKAWLTYFTEGFKPALEVISLIDEKESVLKLKLDLILFESKLNSLTFKLGREILASALKRFPENRYFHSLLEDFLVRPNAVDKTWRSLDFGNSLISQNEAVKVLISNFAQCQDFSYLNRAKSLLEQFVSKAPGRYSPVNWRRLLWTTFELEKQQKNEDASFRSTNEVFHRSLQDCPVTKALYLDAACYLHMDNEDDLGKVLSIPVEKGARIRLPLEELNALLIDET